MSVETAHAMTVRERDPGDEERGPSAGPGRDDPHGGHEGPLWVGVVRSPPEWFRRRVDLLRPRLGLLAETREELDRRTRDLRMQGLCEEGAHNAAWAELGVDDRYRERLATASGDLSDVFDALASRERPIVLATDRRPGFRCHRTVLASAIREQCA